MADVLDQAEVDALLSAVDGGNVAVAQAEGGGERAVQPYDFKRPERVSKDQIRALRNLHDAFARNFGASLSTFLRTIVDVKLASVEQLTYSEFITSLPNPTCFNLLSMAPLEGEVVLEINPSIIFPIIDRLLGGGGITSAPPERPLTEIELRLVDRILGKAIEELKGRWEPIRPVDFKVTQTESNPQLMQIVPPNEAVVLVAFEIAMGEASGMMNLCIPFTAIEPIMGEFTAEHWFSYGKREVSKEQQDRIRDGLRKAKLELVCYLAQTKITVRQFLDLEAGDLLETGVSMNADLLVAVEGKPKFKGRGGILRGAKAVRVTNAALADAPPPGAGGK
ncbi:MAG: flagellar motor switch protein FliM [Planctomycetota bacterium]